MSVCDVTGEKEMCRSDVREEKGRGRKRKIVG